MHVAPNSARVRDSIIPRLSVANPIPPTLPRSAALEHRAERAMLRVPHGWGLFQIAARSIVPTFQRSNAPPLPGLRLWMCYECRYTQLPWRPATQRGHPAPAMLMNSPEIYLPQLGDRVQLRKSHPCGGDSWRVVRVGADIGLQCERCERRVQLERPVLRKRLKKVLPPDPPAG